MAVEGCAALGKLLEPQDCVQHILPVIVNFSQVIMSVGFYADDLHLKEMLNLCTFSLSRISLGVCAIWLQINSTSFVKPWDLSLLGKNVLHKPNAACFNTFDGLI